MNYITTKDALTIELTGREQIWALKSKLIIPKKRIARILFLDIFKDWRKYELRLPGTGMPGKLVAGSFWTEEGWDFLYLKNPHGWLHPYAQHVLCIETDMQKFKRIIVSCDKDQANILANWKLAK